MGLPRGDAQYLFYREAAVVDGVSAGRGTGHGVAGAQQLAPAPLPAGGPLPARHSLPPGRQSGLTPTGPERAQLPAFTFKTTIATCACPPECLIFKQDN